MASVSTNASSSTIVQTLNIQHLISVKLDRQTYLLCRTQFIPLLRGYGLEGYVDGSLPCPPRILTNDKTDDELNPAYTVGQKQDQILLG